MNSKRNSSFLPAPTTSPVGVLPYKDLMGTCSPSGCDFGDFCLKQGNDFITLLKKGIFSWQMS